jgi:hypothetical protein
MNETTDERLYNLLPALYRQRDQENGEALRALMAVLQSEFLALETDMAATYDNWFIQTCDNWVVPYLADLLGIRDMSQAKTLFPTQRRQVANTIGYRRRKGTLAVLEHVLRDTTGWLARVVELSQMLASTQHIGHARPDRVCTVDLRQSAALAELDGPFDNLARTADVRNVSPEPGPEADHMILRQGKYGLGHVGLFLWRLKSYPMRNCFAHVVGRAKSGIHSLYTFDPLGRDMPLFNGPRSIIDITQRAEAIHMPLRISREAFAADLTEYQERCKGRLPEECPPNSTYYGPDRSLNVILPNGTSIPPIEVVSMDLSHWHESDALPNYDPAKTVAIDVHLGRLALLNPPAHITELKVNYCYGLSDEVGGGPYRRAEPLQNPEQRGFQRVVAKGTRLHTLQEALEQWEQHCQKNPQSPTGVIRILDNGVYGGQIVVRLPAGAQLAIVADNGVRPTLWPIGNLVVDCTEAEPTKAQKGKAAHSASTSDATRPGHAGEFQEAQADRGVLQERKFLLNGLLVYGGLDIREEGQPLAKEKLTVIAGHCTLMPYGIKATLNGTDAKGLEIKIDHCIVGPLQLPAEVNDLTVTDSIVDHGSGYAIAADAKNGQPGPAATLQRVTVFGQVSAQRVTARDVIFTGRVIAPQPETQDQVRSSYVPEGSMTPKGAPYPPISTGKLPPLFISKRYGDPAYAQLSEHSPREIRGGGSGGSEMGVFHDLHPLQAEANIRSVLDEYLPFGLQAGVFYVT